MNKQFPRGKVSEDDEGALPMARAQAQYETAELFDYLCASCWDGYIDGGSLQDLLVKAGVLVETTMAEPCGDACNCREFDAVFPTTCFRKNYKRKPEAAGTVPGQQPPDAAEAPK